MKPFLRLVLLCLGTLLSASSSVDCTPQMAAAIAPIVKDVIVEILDAQQKLELLDGAAAEWFRRYPNADMQAKYAWLSSRVRSTLNAALQSTYGARDLAEGEVDEAFASFGKAWQELYELAEEAGIVSSDGTMRAGSVVGVRIEPPLALRHGG